MSYRPLPDSVTIKNSEINGLGLFAKKDISEGIELGVSHYLYDKEIIRTPLGGFYNHSEEPNAKKYKLDNKYVLVTIKEIKKGDEITVKYTFPQYKGYLI